MALSIGKKNTLTDLLKDGYRHFQGLDEAVYANIKACADLCQITRTSMGPNGRNKMVINHLEKLFITNDANTILTEMEIVHPAASLLIAACKHQEAQIGDYTNFLLTFAGELLLQAEELLRSGIKVADVIDGYEKAAKKVLALLPTLSIDAVANFKDEKELSKVVYAAVSSKQFGLEGVLVPLIVKACTSVMPRANPATFNVDFVRCVKIAGGSVHDSVAVNGMVFEREPETKLKNVLKAKIAIFTCPIDITTTETKGTVLLHDAAEMLNFSKGEEQNCEDSIRALAQAGFNVLVTNGAIGDVMLHFINRYGMMAIKVMSSFDIRRLSRMTGATPSARFGLLTAEEVGTCDVVECIEIGNRRCTVFRQEAEASRTSTIVVRAATSNQLEDIEKAIDDGVAAVKVATKDARLLAGAGAIEAELCKAVEAYAEETPGLAQYAIRRYADAFAAVPQILAENAGQNGVEAVAKLRALHAAGKATFGIDIADDDVRFIDAAAAGIFDVYHSKASAITLATEAAMSVLRVDQIIMSRMANGPKPRTARPQDED